MGAADSAARQAELDARRAHLARTYPASWARMMGQWTAPRGDCSLWLMYAANYMLHTAGQRWAVDPFRLGSRLPAVPPFDVGRDLDNLDFVLLTHAHADHVDAGLWRHLQATACHWVVPEHMLALFESEVVVAPGRVAVARPGRPLTMGGAIILPFDAPHYEIEASGREKRVPATGYLVEVAGRRILLAGDVRTYDPAAVPACGPVSVVLAHVFLGRHAALDPSPPLLPAFVDFYRSFNPGRVLLTHLDELGRGPVDCWIEPHGQLAAAAFARLGIEAVIPAWYEETLF